MQIEKAKALNEFFILATKTCSDFCSNESIATSIPDDVKALLHPDKFNVHYSDFKTELIENIKYYQNIDIISDYTIGCFHNITEWEGFDKDDNKRIIAKGHEIKFLIETKEAIKSLNAKITTLCTPYSNDPDVDCLDDLISEVLKKNCDFDDIFNEYMSDSENDLIKIDYRFDFENIKTRLNSANSMDEKRKLIVESMFDMEAWKIQNDKMHESKDGSIKWQSASSLYPKFEQLCNNELKRLDALENKSITATSQPVEPKENTTAAIQNLEHNPYTWNANDIDLVELIAAMHASESTKRTDGKKLTQKELFKHFQVIFNIELKNIPSNLNKAGNRKNGITPFLDKLKLSFENYVEEKETNLNKRK